LNGNPDKVTRAVLSLGSNLGLREISILGAVYELGCEDRIEVVAHSSLYETEPVGGGFSSAFINSVCIVETGWEPLELLGICKRLEHRYGRRRPAARRDRPLDIDIVLYGDVSLSLPDLKLPHPRFRERAFVLVPLTEIAPEMQVLQGSITAAGILEREPLHGWVRKISSRRVANKTT
jgi:2-amino-4-hydroxy-6-hydroxymethyldihydropteridine diphosphokinase